jgi:hypothetical protein
MVGYKQPPAHTKFQKGRSGNPKGRPKKARANKSAPTPGTLGTADSLALQEAERTIKIREGEEVREIPTIEAVFRAQAKSAISGNAFAQRDVVNRYEKAENERRRKIAEECEVWERYIENCRRLLAAAEAKGEPPPKLFPHPDDIFLDRKKGAFIRGPIDEEEAAMWGRLVRQRDLYIMQGVLDQRSWRKSNTKTPSPISTALVIAQLFNDSVPRRLRLSEGAFMSRILENEIMTKRTLVKALYQGWREVDLPMRRGAIFPPWRNPSNGKKTKP